MSQQQEGTEGAERIKTKESKKSETSIEEWMKGNKFKLSEDALTKFKDEGFKTINDLTICEWEEMKEMSSLMNIKLADEIKLKRAMESMVKREEEQKSKDVNIVQRQINETFDKFIKTIIKRQNDLSTKLNHMLHDKNEKKVDDIYFNVNAKETIEFIEKIGVISESESDLLLKNGRAGEGNMSIEWQCKSNMYNMMEVNWMDNKMYDSWNDDNKKKWNKKQFKIGRTQTTEKMSLPKVGVFAVKIRLCEMKSQKWTDYSNLIKVEQKMWYS
eukprot:54018_1